MLEHPELPWRRVLMTGGTGFVGSAMITSLLKVSKSLVVSARNLPHEDRQSRGVEYVVHDVVDRFILPADFDVIVHAATPASADLNVRNPREMFRIMIQGAENLIEFAARHSKPPIVLLVSSGAVYGDGLKSVELVDESYGGGPSVLDPRSAYAEGKRVSELLVTIANHAGSCRGLIARLFAFGGPDLPRNRHFAIGNFVRDAVCNKRITVRGDGSAVRSYLDERDMAEWLLAILRRGESGFPYHVGSERAISIRDLAYLTAHRYTLMTGNRCEVEILGQSSPLDGVSRYVPSTKKTRQLIGVEETISLEESLDSMIQDSLLNDLTFR